MSNGGRRVEWDDLAIVHKLNIVDALEEESPTREEAMEHLGLNIAQRDEVDEHYGRRQRQLADEDKSIIELQNEVTETMLGYRGGSTNVTQSDYQNMFDKYLGKFVNADLEEYFISTTDDVSKARRFLSQQRMNPSLIDRRNMRSTKESVTKGSDPTVKTVPYPRLTYDPSRCAFAITLVTPKTPTMPTALNRYIPLNADVSVNTESPLASNISKITGRPTRQYKKRNPLPKVEPPVLAPPITPSPAQGELLNTFIPQKQDEPHAELGIHTANVPNAAVVGTTRRASSEKPSQYRRLLATYAKDQSAEDINSNGGSGKAVDAQEHSMRDSSSAGAIDHLVERRKRTYADRISSDRQTEAEMANQSESVSVADPSLSEGRPPRKKRIHGKEAGSSKAKNTIILTEPPKTTGSDKVITPIANSPDTTSQSGIEPTPKVKPNSVKTQPRPPRKRNPTTKKEVEKPKVKDPSLLVQPAYRGTARK